MKSVWDEMREESLAEGMEKGMAKGMEKGIKKGRAEGAQNMQEGIVRTMLKSGELALDKIAEYVGLPLAKVQEMAKSLA